MLRQRVDLLAGGVLCHEAVVVDGIDKPLLGHGIAEAAARRVLEADAPAFTESRLMSDACLNTTLEVMHGWVAAGSEVAAAAGWFLSGFQCAGGPPSAGCLPHSCVASMLQQLVQPWHAPGLVPQNALDVVAVVQLVVEARRHLDVSLWVAVLAVEGSQARRSFSCLCHMPAHRLRAVGSCLEHPDPLQVLDRDAEAKVLAGHACMHACGAMAGKQCATDAGLTCTTIRWYGSKAKRHCSRKSSLQTPNMHG